MIKYLTKKTKNLFANKSFKNYKIFIYKKLLTLTYLTQFKKITKIITWFRKIYKQNIEQTKKIYLFFEKVN